MRKMFKAIVVSGYFAVLVYLLKSEFLDNDVDIELNYILRTPRTVKRLMKEIKNMKKNVTTYTKSFKRPIRLPADYKYILKWTQVFGHFDLPIFKNGQQAFLDSNCTYKNCYITNDKSVLLDIRHFDAIIFDVENTWDTNYLPLLIPHQINIFASTDSAAMDPVCDVIFENFFHMTWTYKLDSTIPSPHITIQDKNNNIIGPKKNMTWIDSMEPTTKEVIAKLKDKKKAVAWFISDCHLMDRMNVVKNLIKSLNKVNLNLDVHGCGNLTCTGGRMEECFSLLQNKYYFYLAFETYVADDYVTEKILYPLLHYTVPIVYGGGDYSRFLPPGSYIDAGKFESDEVVDLMVKAIETPTIYQDYFRWHKHYVYKESPKGANVCTLCEILNFSPNFVRLNNFRRWWNSNYENICKMPYIKNSQFKF